MVNITQDQALRRWDTIPGDIKDEIISDASADFVWKACDEEHLPEEKRYDVLEAVGYVLLGFIHPEDLAQEIVDRLNINKQSAESIASYVDKRLFAPIKDELVEIYEPPSAFEPLPKPKIFEEIKVPTPAEFPAPSVAAQAPKQFVPEPKKISPLGVFGTESPLNVAELKKPPAPPSPASAATKPPMPIATPSPAPFIPKPAEIKPEKLSEPPPTMLHEEAVTKPLRGASGFSIELGVPKFTETKPEMPPKTPAILEGFQSAKPETPKVAKAPPEKPRVVHYTEFRTPLEPSLGKPLDSSLNKPPEKKPESSKIVPPPISATKETRAPINPPTAKPLEIKIAPQPQMTAPKPQVPPLASQFQPEKEPIKLDLSKELTAPPKPSMPPAPKVSPERPRIEPPPIRPPAA